MNKLMALFDVFRKGSAVAEPALWKNRQITSTVLTALIVAVVNALAAFGYSLPVDVETANAIAAGILAVVNTVLTVTTSDKVGIPVKTVKEEVTDAKTEELPEIFSNTYK